MFEKTGLVLEGGGFRGIYSAGILDYFLEKKIEFPYVIGVSMGACNGTNYISKQIGRNLRVPYNYMNDRRYISLYNLITQGSLFGMDFVFGEIPKKLDLFDWESYKESDQRFVIVATNCQTGQPAYFEKGKMDDILEVLKASSSIPFLANMIEIDGENYLDGGVTDSIPVRKAIDDGNEKLVVVLTRPEGYYKKPSNISFLTRMVYSKYPRLVDSIENRYRMYNETLEYIRRLESQGRAFVIRPSHEIEIKSVERNRDKLKAAFEMGYKDGMTIEERLMAFLAMK